MISSSDSVTCRHSSQNSGKHFTYYCQFIIKDMVKDTDRQTQIKRFIGKGLEGSQA
jgi:hypothetical protein